MTKLIAVIKSKVKVFLCSRVQIPTQLAYLNNTFLHSKFHDLR